MAPPLYSTFSALTELVVTAAVFAFFYSALKNGTYRWGIIVPALVYEVFFNITYMTSRLFGSDAAAGPEHATWFKWFLGFHGTLSLVMFIGLIWFIVWALDQTGKDRPDPIGDKRRLAYGFLGLWTVSILSGEIVYGLMWTDWTYA